jgi:hypothetical protein
MAKKRKSKNHLSDDSENLGENTLPPLSSRVKSKTTIAGGFIWSILASLVAGVIFTFFLSDLVLPSAEAPIIKFKNTSTPFDNSLASRIGEVIQSYNQEKINEALVHLNSITLSLQSREVSSIQKAMISTLMGACYLKQGKLKAAENAFNSSIHEHPSSFA